MGIALAIAVTIIVISVTRWYFHHRKFMKHLKKFPGPPPLPIVGNALDFSTTTALFPKFLEYSEKYGGKVKLHIGPTPTVLLISDYDLIEFILSSTKILNKGFEYRYMAGWLGNGLILSTADKWRKQRKILNPTFHFKILEQFVEIFESNAAILTEKLKKELHSPSVDVLPYLKLCMLDAISETVMGTSVNAQTDSDCAYVRSVHVMCQILMTRWFGAFLRYDIFYKLSRLYQEEKKAVKILHEYTNSVIKKRKAELSNEGKGESEKASTKGRLALLDLLLQESATNHNLTDQDIREQVDNFIFAGHDTTASTVSFALYCLADNPDVQEKVVEELREVFADDRNRPMTVRDVQNMKYLEMVVKETLRIYPVVPIFARNAHEDIVYEDTILPKGVSLVINVGGVHRNPKFYPEPQKFIPERFSADNAIDKQPYAYLPFSVGPRNCIGNKFAMLKMKAALCTILKSFKILPAKPKHNLILSAEGVMVSSNGICVALEERNF